MKNRIIITFAIVIFLVPQITFAAWWNPFTWKVFNKVPQTKVQEKNVVLPAPKNIPLKKENTESTEVKDVQNKVSMQAPVIDKIVEAPVSVKKITIPKSKNSESAQQKKIAITKDLGINLPHTETWEESENKFFAEADQKQWANLVITNQAGDKRYYRRENGFLVRKNSEEEAYQPWSPPLPLTQKTVQCSSGSTECAGQCWSACPSGQQLSCTMTGAVCINAPIAQTLPQIQQNEIDTLKKEVEILKNQKPQIQTIIKEVPVKTGFDLPSIVSQWRPQIAHIECRWYSANGQLVLDAYGSGLLFRNPVNTLIFTNKHVLIYQGQAPYSCKVTFPGTTDNYNLTVNTSTGHFDDINRDPVFDVGEIFIRNPSTYLNSISGVPNDCKTRAAVGEQVLILGYPEIGSTTDITATEGIISGYENGYYITSAKVDHGNSGGVAILVKDNCYLGIPSFVQAGQLESLARILDFNNFENYLQSQGAN